MNKEYSITKNLIEKTEILANEHALFMKNHIETGRRALYDLLAKIFALVKEFDNNPDKKNLINVIRKKLAEDLKIKVQDNTSDVAAIVKYITRVDRKAAHVYTRVIEKAKLLNINPQNLPAYISAQGGIEKIRSLGVSQEQQEINSIQEERLKLARTCLFAQSEFPLGTINLINKKITNIEPCDFHYFVGKSYGDQFIILGRVPATQDYEKATIKLFANQESEDINVVREKIQKLIRSSEIAREVRNGSKQSLIANKGEIDTEFI